MKINMGATGPLMRIVLALIIGILYLTGQITGIGITVLGVIAIMFLLTSSVGYCPMFQIINISTRNGR
jgi:hypothetical protein